MEILRFLYLPLLGLAIINLVMAASYVRRLVRGRGQRNGIVMLVSLSFSIAVLTLTGIVAWLTRRGNVADWVFVLAPGMVCVVTTVLVFWVRPGKHGMLR